MPRKQRDRLSPTQSEIMQIFWERGELSAFELREILSKDRELARGTVRTTLDRMEIKGWLHHRVVGRTFFYSAAVEREGGLRHRAEQLVEEFGRGAPEELVCALLDSCDITDEESARVRKIIERARTRQPRGGEKKKR